MLEHSTKINLQKETKKTRKMTKRVENLEGGGRSQCGRGERTAAGAKLLGEFVQITLIH